MKKIYTVIWDLIFGWAFKLTPLTGSLEERKGETAVVSKHKRRIKQTYDLSRNPCKKYVGRGKPTKQ